MIYSDFNGIKLSKLAFGTMRLPVLDNDYSKIDKEKTKEMFKLAFEKGVNYFDTAWMYHDHTSEDVVGEILRTYPRNSFYIASKFPGFSKDAFDKKEEIFDIQMRKLGLGYFDFYLMHDICESNVEYYITNYNNIVDFLLKKKEEGKIIHLGCSTHGSLETMKKFLDKYSNIIEFVQIQLNYLDYIYQNAKEKVELITSYNLPVWVMEPVRGGKLSDLKELNHYFKDVKPNDSISRWGYRYVSSFDEVKVILSGMSSLDQVKDNLETFENDNKLSKEELTIVEKVRDIILSQNTIPCTKCNYCKSVCPKGIAISEIFGSYNDFRLSNRKQFTEGWLEGVEKEKMPNECIQCHKCESICPQTIKIPDLLAKIDKEIVKK